MDFGDEEIGSLLNWRDLISAMEGALAAYSAGRVLQPVRTTLIVEE